MAIGQTERLDYLLKKIGYTNSKTGIAVDSSLSGTKKAPFAESIPSPLVLPGKNVWAQSNEISTTPPTSSTSVVGVYTGATTLLLTEDNTVSNKRAFLARSTPGNNSSAMLSDWVDTQFGSDYIVKIYAGNPPTAGVTTQLSAGGSGNNDEWFFDYSSGVLNFIDTNVPTLVGAGNSVWLVGYRYIGEKGVFSSGDDLSVGILTATSIFVGAGTSTGTASQKLQVGSASTPGGAYISGSVGIGTTNPTSQLWVQGDGYFSGIVTSSGFYVGGNLIGGGISGTNIVGTALSISGISTFTNGPVLIGGGTSTGTVGQVLQVAGISSSAYIGGNLGIGNTNPSVKLQVSGGDVTIDRGSVTGSLLRNLTIGGARNSATGLGFAGINFSNYDSGNGAVDYNAVRLIAQQPAGAINGGLLAIYTTPNNSTTAVERVRVFDTGEVGINTTVVTGTANQPLQVSGGSVYIAGDASGNGLGIGITNPAYPVDIKLNAPTNATALLRISPNTGTRAAQILYSNAGSGNMVTGLLNSSGDGQGLNGLTAYAGVVGINSGTSPLLITTNGLERVRVTDTGLVGIGTTNPSNKLHVLDSLEQVSTFESTSTSVALRLKNSTSANVYLFNKDDNNFVVRSGGGAGSETLRVTSTSVGIGTTNPTSKLHVVGDTYISGILTATDINSASDIRLKTNIKPFENTLEKIVQINGVSFNWIENNAKSGGIIAQDVEKVFPELVNDGDHKTVNYNGLIGVLVESIKELKQEIEDLKSRIPPL